MQHTIPIKLHNPRSTLQQSSVAVNKTVQLHILRSRSQQSCSNMPDCDGWNPGCHVDGLCVCHQKPLRCTAFVNLNLNTNKLQVFQADLKLVKFFPPIFGGSEFGRLNLH